MDPGQNKIERQIAVGHWDNRVDRIRVTAEEMEEGKYLILAVDGQIEEPVGKNDQFVVTKYEKPLQVLNPPGYSYFSVLTKKLHWRGSYV